MYRPIVATLGYVLSTGGDRVLLMHRNQRPTDAHFGKYNGLGGKLKAHEDVVGCLFREIQEEAGIECLETLLRGTVSWPGFGPGGEDWFGFIFLVTRWQGDPRSQCPEGTLEWMEIDRLDELPMWEGDRFFLPLVLGDRSRQFYGVMPYRNGRPVGWTHHEL